MDRQKAQKFLREYSPQMNMLLTHIKWKSDKIGGLYYIPCQVQVRVFEELGRENYIRLPKPGTNPRDIELNKGAMLKLLEHPETKKIKIVWERREIKYNPYERWVAYWQQDITESSSRKLLVLTMLMN